MAVSLWESALQVQLASVLNAYMFNSCLTYELCTRIHHYFVASCIPAARDNLKKHLRYNGKPAFGSNLKTELRTYNLSGHEAL
jgi:hypothetical protein